jgi:hypothetical protein
MAKEGKKWIPTSGCWLPEDIVELDNIRMCHSPLNADFSQHFASILEIAGHI